MKFLCSETSVDIIQEFTHKFDRKIMEKADYQGYGPDDFIEFKVYIFSYLIFIQNKILRN